MNIAASSLQLGPYTVQQRQEPDRQWPLWWVFLGTVLIGKCFSRPCESDCAYLHHQQLHQTGYAYSSAKLPTLSLTGSNGRFARYLAKKPGR